MAFAEEVDRAQKQLDKLGEAIQKGLRPASKAGAEVFAEEARRKAPRLTGRLARSIKISAGKKSGNASEYKVVAGAFYAYYVEYGTSKMSPKPFFRPTADSKADAIATAMEEEIKARTRPVTG